MPETIDLKGLTHEQINILQGLVKIFHTKVEIEPKTAQEDTPFTDYPLGVVGTLRREDIYDDLRC